VKSVNAQFLASNSDILSSQHSSVWGGLVTIGLDFHASSHTRDGFAATGITQNVSLTIPLYQCIFSNSLSHLFSSRVYGPEIGDVHEGIIETGEDSGDSENEFSVTDLRTFSLSVCTQT
jgi:hypothetical protein